MVKTKSVLITVVTHNRIADLKVCIESIRHQSYKSFDILIINNGSDDGTKEWLATQPDIIAINQENVGGAGGFFTGMKYMYDNGYQWLLMMDDDGISDKDELKNLMAGYQLIKKEVADEIILNSLVVDKDNHRQTAFFWARGSGRSRNIEDLKQTLYFKDIHPFNGTLIKRSVIDKIGFIKKEMFIWGDEKEYMARALHYGIRSYTYTSAIHYHPKEKGIRGNVIPFISRFQILLKPHNMSHIFYRNEGYIYNVYPERRDKMFIFCAAYIIRFITHLEIVELIKFIKFFRRGMNNIFY